MMNTLSNALLSRGPTTEYREAVTKALDIPDCQVRPIDIIIKEKDTMLSPSVAV